MDTTEASGICQEVLDEISDTVVVDEDVTRTLLTAILGKGHLLLEDVPGTGKTLTAQSLATALGLEFSRIQFTPDLLPGDITGTQVYNEDDNSFRFEEGPIFANVVLADEINRAPPKTQAALLEAMSESQVSAGGETRRLPEPFFVVATQNPVEQEGTFELPEAQLDRFMVKTSVGYPERSGELEILDRRDERKRRDPEAKKVVERETVLELQEVPESVKVDRAIKEYVVDLSRATRESEHAEVGVSPRGIQRLYEASKAHAVLSGRDYVAPEDVRAMVYPTLTHRVVLTTEADVRGVEKKDVIDKAVEAVPVPSMEEVSSS